MSEPNQPTFDEPDAYNECEYNELRESFLWEEVKVDHSKGEKETCEEGVL